MSKPVLLVNSVTFAVKGQDLLKKHGIPSRIVRNADFKAVGGCGYGIMPFGDPQTARNILARGGVKVLGVTQAEVPL
ncbi:MAG: DUF3343 domain-containing protein [Oscillospiraceae bacterium]|nr:DUF3343 domain-containing protein [Oscillospiraceae bacterium]